MIKINSLTYAELEAESNRVANALIDLGIEKYDRVAILAHNTIHHVLSGWGAARSAPCIWPSTTS